MGVNLGDRHLGYVAGEKELVVIISPPFDL